MVLPALVWEKPTTLGTLIVESLLDTVSLTTVVDLTEVPAAGSCVSTVPGALLLVTYVVLNDSPAVLSSSTAALSCWPTTCGTGTLTGAPALTTRLTWLFLATLAPAFGSVEMTSPFTVLLLFDDVDPTKRFSSVQGLGGGRHRLARHARDGHLLSLSSASQSKTPMTARTTKRVTKMIHSRRTFFRRSASARLTSPPPGPPGRPDQPARPGSSRSP